MMNKLGISLGHVLSSIGLIITGLVYLIWNPAFSILFQTFMWIYVFYTLHTIMTNVYNICDKRVDRSYIEATPFNFFVLVVFGNIGHLIWLPFFFIKKVQFKCNDIMPREEYHTAWRVWTDCDGETTLHILVMKFFWKERDRTKFLLQNSDNWEKV